jgi:cytochrome P450
LKDGAFHPLFFLIPAFDTKYRHLFPRRVQLHQDLKRFMGKVEDIIVNKRAQLAEGRSQLDEAEKDLCTLMLEAEADGEGSSLTNEELLVTAPFVFERRPYSFSLCVYFYRMT